MSDEAKRRVAVREASARLFEATRSLAEAEQRADEARAARDRWIVGATADGLTEETAAAITDVPLSYVRDLIRDEAERLRRMPYARRRRDSGDRRA